MVCCLFIDKAIAQNFVPSTTLGGSSTVPASYDLTNDNANGNVGIGYYPGRPNAAEKLTVGGDIRLDPPLQQVQRRLYGHAP